MISAFERLGTVLLNRLVPSATAAAGPCSCEPGTWWCCNAGTSGNYCYCEANNGTCYVRYGFTLECPPCTGC
ncbi:hypothetical protein O7605_04855 [Verrucosispora sp. WMMA2121]|uniref:hypothetical protein n=1 Tax=Verrucosispora sp. WMMA2121 TaxID=3015164 RepID=UPI0022B72DD9|nr:hypothetical protein [Verrucosispora sp. WMMA2121]MCZ7418847.1 hypothetical protein [Verrucosispora sp. WMMA2121]